MIIKAIREGLGRIIILGNFITQPKPLVRSDAAQKKVDSQCQSLALYQFYACPFCVKIRRAIRRLNLNIELKDAQNNPKHRAELEQLGGRIKVPCLRIAATQAASKEDQWLYESNDIISYLEENFAESSQS